MGCKPEIRFGRIRRNKGITGIYNELHDPAKHSLGFRRCLVVQREARG
jgi:hypothetical protein